MEIDQHEYRNYSDSKDEELKRGINNIFVLPSGESKSKKDEAFRLFNSDFVCKSVFVLVASSGPIKKLDSISSTLDVSVERVYQCIETLLEMNFIKFTDQGYVAELSTLKNLNVLNPIKQTRQERLMDHRDRMIYFCNEFAKGSFEQGSDFNTAVATDRHTLNWFIEEETKLIEKFYEKSRNAKNEVLVERISALMSKSIKNGEN